MLLGWYPHTHLEMDEDARRQKRGKFGAAKHVYPAPVMAEPAWLVRARARGRAAAGPGPVLDLTGT
ncbi:hypothetical protein GCM10025868_35810 [Angustibacter aerolatus]|uniref:Uncharacterized protein n=1 Tax=Angustibacter aerolatus TaxID=1162965 RepID=A0ABQ6JJ96_9ACTN|nr:hypothetical protein [Angustibacter aerolatus]GMA88331.1 hypothetical protein GCM10025868_35810 [Angustibacter aerolatus]